MTNPLVTTRITITLPLASAVGPNFPVTCKEASGSVTPGFDVVTQGSDVIDTPGYTTFPVDSANMAITFVSNGVNRWHTR